jgi:hypothetical protein
MNNRMDAQRQHQRAQLGLIQAQVQQYKATHISGSAFTEVKRCMNEMWIVAHAAVE